MGLKTQTPFGVRLTVGSSSLHIEGLLEVVHGLKIVMRKVEVFKMFGRHLGSDLRVDQLELIASGADEFGAGLGSHRPSRRLWGNPCPIGFNGDLKTNRLTRLDQRIVQLQGGLTARKDHKGMPGALNT